MVRHSLRMTAGTLASRILGMLREILTAAFFGATRELDAFYVAYTLANLSRQLLAEGALSATFVPVFSQTLAKDGLDRAERLAKEAVTLLLAMGTLVVTAGIIFAPYLVFLIAPGFKGPDAVLATNLTRFLMPYLILVSLAALAMGALNSMESFFVPAIAPAAANLVYIVAVSLLYWRMGIWAPAVAVLLGGCFQMGLQWAWCAGKGLVLIPAMPGRDPELWRMVRLFFPYAAGLSLNQFHPIINRILGSFLEDGAISVLNYADRLIQLPLGLFVIAVSQAVLPLFSRAALEDEVAFADIGRDALRFALFIVSPITLCTLLYAGEAVHLLFYRGAFGDWAWRATSGALFFYALGLPGMACNNVTLRALYARRFPKAAFFVVATSVLANLACSVVLMRFLSYRGLALSSAIAFTSASLVGGRFLRASLGRPIGLFDIPWVSRLALSLAITGGASMFYKFLIPYPLGAGLSLRTLWMCGAFAVGAASYIITVRRLKCAEWRWVAEAIRRDKARAKRDE